MSNAQTPGAEGDPEAPDSVDEELDEQELPVPEPEQSAEPDDGRHSPADWAKLLMPPGARGQQHPDLWKHGAAEQLHHWPKYEHDNARPIRLTQAEYEAALKAASTVDKKTGGYTPHQAALGLPQPQPSKEE